MHLPNLRTDTQVQLEFLGQRGAGETKWIKGTGEPAQSADRYTSTIKQTTKPQQSGNAVWKNTGVKARVRLSRLWTDTQVKTN